jgi:hypothetical protein
MQINQEYTCEFVCLNRLVVHCRHVEVAEEGEEVEEFQLIEKLQQLGINAGESASTCALGQVPPAESTL